MIRTSESTAESDERTSARQGGERTPSGTGDRASRRDRAIEGIQRRVGNGTVQRLAGADGRSPGTDADVITESARPGDHVQRMCPRCRRRAREGKPLNCPECEAELQRSESPSDSPDVDAGAAHASTPMRDAGLTINDPDDRYEREADAVAEAVIRMATPGRRRGGVGSSGVTGDGSPPNASPSGVGAARTGGSVVQRICARCSNRLAAGKPLNCPECEEKLQRKADGLTAASAGGDVADELAAARGRGRPLPRDVRSFFEPRFDCDFGEVRVHTGPRADDLSRSLGARAFTYGRDVFFASGEYRPTSRDGRRLLAHELTRTIQ